MVHNFSHFLFVEMPLAAHPKQYGPATVIKLPLGNNAFNDQVSLPGRQWRADQPVDYIPQPFAAQSHNLADERIKRRRGLGKLAADNFGVPLVFVFPQ